MNRKEFLQNSALGLTAALVVPSLFTGCKEDLSPIETDKQIVIIGAGVAGLRAAHYFRQRGVEVIVLEAQEKAGGRVRTNRSLGISFDEGASWIHGAGRKNPITDLAEAAGATTFETNDEVVSVYDTDGTQYDSDYTDDQEKEFNRIFNNLSGSTGESFGDKFYADNSQYAGDRFWTYMLSAYTEFDTGADIYQLSSQDFDNDESFRGSEALITNGYDVIVDYLAEGIDIRLNTRIDSIDYSSNEVLITSDIGEMFTADHVIVAVPLGVLKAESITFTPALPSAKLDAISALQMGSVNKYLCVYDSAFWDTTRHYIGYTPEEKGKFNYFLNLRAFSDTNALMTFTFGDYSVAAEQKTDSELMEEITEHLRAIYGSSVPLPSQFLRTLWNTNINAFGSYSFVGKDGRSTAFGDLAGSVNDQLFFAGEHTFSNYRGTVHGAYLSGEREAKRIAEILEA